jgi:hypothetical protein
MTFNHPGFTNVFDTDDLKTRIDAPVVWTKGNELCNRTACQTARNVFMWNHSTKAYYCVQCARLINSGAGTMNGTPLCSIDEDKRLYETEFKHKNLDTTYEDFKNDIVPSFIF